MRGEVAVQTQLYQAVPCSHAGTEEGYILLDEHTCQKHMHAHGHTQV
jgi:hypothetical protein